MTKPLPGQVLEEVDPRRCAGYRAWLEDWIERGRAGEPVRILVALDGSHVVVVAT